jgi:hypothetical protein
MSRVSEIISLISRPMPELVPVPPLPIYNPLLNKVQAVIPKPIIDEDPLLELNEKYYSKGKQPPVLVVSKAMRKAGFSEERIEKFIKWHKKMDDSYEKRTEDIEKFFSKWPSASKGAGKKKAIKAVMKKT